MKAKNLEALNDPPKILFHGDSATGKTALIAQLSNGYLMDFDGGMKTAFSLSDEFTKYRHAIEFDVFKDKSFRNPQGWQTGYAKLLSIAEQCAANKWPYDALCIDSMTGICQVIRHFVMKSKTGDALAEPERNHWGMMVNCMEAVCSIIMTLNVPVIITAHDCTVYTDDDVTYKVLGITKNHGEKIPWMFDEVWLAKVMKKGLKRNFVISGEGTAARLAKTRMNLGKDVNHTEIGLPGIFKMIDFKYNFDGTDEIKGPKVKVVESKVGAKEVMTPKSSAENLLT